MAQEGLSASEYERAPGMFHIEDDAALLQAIVVPGLAVSTPFVDQLNHHIEIGSQLISIHTGTKTRQAIDEARSAAVVMVGLDRPEHPLHETFLKIHTHLRHISPRLFGTLKPLAAIGDPVAMIRDVPRLWLLSSELINHQKAHLGRLATVLKWQGEQKDSSDPTTYAERAHELIREHPGILLYSVARLGALARIAAEFGEDRHRFLSKKAVAQRIVGRSLEAHIAGIVRRRDYEFGMCSSGTGAGKKQLREEMYESLSDPDYVERVGKPVLWAYFRANPPSAEARQRFPAVRAFVPKGGCRGDSLRTIRTYTTPDLITGQEEWLKEMLGLPRNPTTPRTRAKRQQILATLNWHIALGSHSLRKIPSEEGVSRVYELISDHRLAFFDMLGWTDAKHALVSSCGGVRPETLHAYSADTSGAYP